MHQKENRAVKEKLDHELGELYFTGHERVLRKTHPKSFNEKLSSFWNKELEIPVLPIVLTVGLFFTTISIKSELFHTETHLRADREMIEFAGYTYWKDDFEKAVKLHENKSEN
ncbi:hypothetical protein AB685_10515 [Bacillus sp. LL01]|uniref:hypothetical protein n=1 Tax=Bacillus sp. LL01 TaxID=1665556 RepID=UPI00064D35A8|nr:hypothetical protein [Bacillus sp. LL01]KMJ58328.1 hypothetical protein AB685_10515 [Bacillus sp. LL01]